MKLCIAVLAVFAASACWGADAPPTAPTLRRMLCTQEGVSKGYKGKELDEFVSKCLRAKDMAKEPVQSDDDSVPSDTPNC